MTEQEWRQMAFNGAWRGLKSQGFVQSKLGNSCAYRTGGRHGRVCCAVGWLMPDEKWRPEQNHARAQAVGPLLADALQPVTASRAQWLARLQQKHDRSTDPAAMERRLRRFARAHGLTIPDELRDAAGGA